MKKVEDKNAKKGGGGAGAIIGVVVVVCLAVVLLIWKPWSAGGGSCNVDFQFYKDDKCTRVYTDDTTVASVQAWKDAAASTNMRVCEPSLDKYSMTTCSKDGGFSSAIYDDAECTTVSKLDEDTELKDETTWGHCYTVGKELYYKIDFVEE